MTAIVSLNDISGESSVFDHTAFVRNIKLGIFVGLTPASIARNKILICSLYLKEGITLRSSQSLFVRSCYSLYTVSRDVYGKAFFSPTNDWVMFVNEQRLL